MAFNIKNPIKVSRLKALKKVVGKGPVLITTHHNPDPDGLASGEAFSFLLKEAWHIPSRLVYTGIVARAENRAMLKNLTCNWEAIEDWHMLKDYPVVALVDTQPGSGNNELPKDFIPHIVFDHHIPVRPFIDRVAYADIRTEIGAVSTMLFQYLEAAGLKSDRVLTTSLFYGIKTDTKGLSRGRSVYDEATYFKLLSCIDHSMLCLVEQAQLPLIYFQALDNALRATTIYGKTAVAKLGDIHQPDLPAELADILIRLEGADASFCMGRYKDKLNISLRMRRENIDAGYLINNVIGDLGMSGGHKSMAGGQILLHNKDIKEIEENLIKKFLEAMEETSAGMSLLGKPA